MSREFWLEGPVEGIPPQLMPVAHALLQAQYDLRAATTGIAPQQLWHRPNGAASLGFHLRHIAGSLDRLLTYALGGELSDIQREYLAREKAEPEELIPLEILLAHLDRTVETAIGILHDIPDAFLLNPRLVGRAQRPSTVIGLLFHAAEHTQRHTGQVITTAKFVSGR